MHLIKQFNKSFNPSPSSSPNNWSIVYDKKKREIVSGIIIIVLVKRGK